MNRRHIYQIIFGLAAAFALFAAPLAACACDDHEVAAAEATECDQHAGAAVVVEHGAESFAPDHRCTCIEPAPRTMSKSDAGKYSHVVLTDTRTASAPADAFSSTKTAACHFGDDPADPLSGFDRLNPSRGPPRA